MEEPLLINIGHVRAGPSPEKPQERNKKGKKHNYQKQKAQKNTGINHNKAHDIVIKQQQQPENQGNRNLAYLGKELYTYTVLYCTII